MRIQRLLLARARPLVNPHAARSATVPGSGTATVFFKGESVYLRSDIGGGAKCERSDWSSGNESYESSCTIHGDGSVSGQQIGLSGGECKTEIGCNESSEIKSDRCRIGNYGSKPIGEGQTYF